LLKNDRTDQCLEALRAMSRAKRTNLADNPREHGVDASQMLQCGTRIGWRIYFLRICERLFHETIRYLCSGWGVNQTFSRRVGRSGLSV
jgi:hypothetical protein